MSPVCSVKRAGGAVGEEEAQRLADGRERDFVPRNFAFLEELHFEALLAGVDVDVEQARQIEEMHLMHMRHVQQREEALDLDARAGFLERFAGGAFAVVSSISMKPAGSVQ